MNVAHTHARSKLPGALTSAVLACAALFVVGDELPDGAGAQQQSVYVRDSGVVSERLALAERMERLGEWSKSADVYQEVIDKFSDRVVSTDTDEGRAGRQFVSVAVRVQQKLAKWPAQGLTVYKRRFDDTAAQALETAMRNKPVNRTALRRVLDDYFPTDSARDAGVHLMSDALERGEFAYAAYVGRRLIDLHPSLVAQRATVIFQTAVAYHAAGDKEQASRLLAELRTAHAGVIGTVAGREVVLADELVSILAAPQAFVRTYRSNDWPMSFGSTDASAVPDVVSPGGAKLFSVSLIKPRNSANPRGRQFEQAMTNLRRSGAMTGILPAIDSGELFFQDNVRVYALSLTSGLPLPGWSDTFPGEQRGAFSLDSATPTRGKQLGVSVTPDRVIALLGQSDANVNNFGQRAVSPSMLVCLDRALGKRVWATSLARLKLPDTVAQLREGQFYGLPVVSNDTIYTLVKLNRGGQFEECHVVALGLKDGSFLWSSYVASTSTGRQMEMDETGVVSGTVAQLSYSDGRCYVLTNSGATACIDAANGKTFWLNIYAPPQPARIAGNRFGNARITTSVGKPYEITPPLVVDGRVFVMPTDGSDLLVYDAMTGNTVATVPRKLRAPASQSEPFAPATTLLAVVGDRVVLGNSATIFSVPWRDYAPDKNVVENRGYFKRFTGSGKDEADAIQGRPFVSGNNVLVATDQKLYRMGLNDFRFQDIYPSNGSWDEQEEAGNVLATPEHLIIAGPTRVTAYADMNAATARLDQQITQSPDDVPLYLRYAELLLAGGRTVDALPKLDAAIERLGGRTALRAGSDRQRLFEICLNFAARLQRTDEPDLASLDALLERARISANTPAQQVRYRIEHAGVFKASKKTIEEVALYQQILANPLWRVTPASVAKTSNATNVTAGAYAARSITDAITSAGPAVYAPYESKAGELFKAYAGNDPKTLLAIADEYPNASVVTDVLRAAAESFEKLDQPTQATRTLRRLILRDLPPPAKLRTIEALARNALNTPRQLDTAVVRLQQASKLDPMASLSTPLKLPDGSTIPAGSFAEARVVVKKYRDKAAASALPTFGIPAGTSAADPTRPAFKPAVTLGAAQAIVRQQPDRARHDRVITYDPATGISQYEVGAEKPVAQPTVITDQPIGCAYVGDALLVVTPGGANRISTSGAQSAWQFKLSDLPAIDVSPDATPRAEMDEQDIDNNQMRVVQQQIRINRLRNRVRVNNFPVAVDENKDDAPGVERVIEFRVTANATVLATSAGRIVNIDSDTGRLNWQARPSDTTPRHLQAGDDFVVAGYTDSQQFSEVVVLDTDLGTSLVRQTYDGQQNQQLINLALSRDGVLVTMLQNRLIGRDLYDPAAPEWKADIGNAQPPAFVMSGLPDQLLITDDRVLTFFRSGNGPVTARAYQLRDNFKPLLVNDPARKRDVDATFSPKSQQNNNAEQQFSLQAVGPAFYIIGQRSLAAWHLDRAEWQWAPASGGVDRGLTREFVITQDYAVLINQIAMPNPMATKVPTIQLFAYSRAISPLGVEAGQLEQRPTIKDPAGIFATQWQIANGAFYYVSGDQKLKMLSANR